MKSLRRFLARLFSFSTRRSRDERLREEIEGHIALQTAENLRAGLSTVEARRQAMLKFGGVEAMKQDYRSERGFLLVENLFQDFRFAIRSLRRTPGVTAFVMITLALGIGMTSATFSMVDALIFRPYPVPHASDVVTLVSTTHDSNFDDFSYREYLDIRDKTESYDGVIANADMQAVGFSAEPGATPRVKGGLMVSGNYFHVLGVEPRLGRAFQEDEDQVPGRDAVVVLGPAFWKHEFASDPSVLGRKVRLNGAEFTVIGVAPENFPGMGVFGHPDFYVPLAMARVFSTDPQKDFFEDRDDRELNVKARLKPGTTLRDARNELAVLAKDFEIEYPKVNRGRGAAVYTQFQTRTIEDGNWKFGVIFAILALAVLLVACTNVAGLLLSRARARKREIAVRLAIGAGRFRLIRLLLTESLILASLGGLAGIAVGYGVVEWFHSMQSIVFMTDLPMTVPMQMDRRVLVVAVALSVLSALLCGLAPALQSTRTDLVNGLKSGDVEMPGRKRLWGRNVLVVAQVSASLMLLTASFLMARSFQHSVLEGTGFKKDHLLMTSFDPRLEQYNATQTKQFYKLLTERVREAPGVESVALTQNVPLGQFDDFDELAFVPDGFQTPLDRENFHSTMDTVDEGYFETMAIPILRGRGFLASDTGDAPRVAVVNDQFAKHYWPTGDAVGKHIRLDSRNGTPVEIVGVAETIKYLSTFERPMDFVYMPLAQRPVQRLDLLLRSNGDPLQLLQPLKDVVHALDPNMPMLRTMTYADLYVNMAVKGPDIAIDLVGAMGVVGLVLAVAGLYGLVAYNVSRRTREIGIRMTLGAASSDVLRLVMGKGLVLVGVGTVIGLAMGFAVEQLMNSMLFNAGGVDVVAYLVVVPMLLLVTMLAAYIPARKASRIAPTEALRYE
ncbi:MAG TPA: ABC transporter permease [Candidatus Methylomirabilis sp.]|nr:ABC transporter permease [Candidatus Methylomirabilis sp.]